MQCLISLVFFVVYVVRHTSVHVVSLSTTYFAPTPTPPSSSFHEPNLPLSLLSLILSLSLSLPLSPSSSALPSRNHCIPHSNSRLSQTGDPLRISYVSHFSPTATFRHTVSGGIFWPQLFYTTSSSDVPVFAFSLIHYSFHCGIHQRVLFRISPAAPSIRTLRPLLPIFATG